MGTAAEWTVSFLAALGLTSLTIWVSLAATRPTWPERLLIATVPLIMTAVLFALSVKSACLLIGR